MHSKNLLFILALFIMAVLFAGSASSASDCSDNVYALTHPECSSSCSNNNYALTHPLECGSESLGCSDNNYALAHLQECGQQAVGCNDNNYALTHPSECGTQPSGCGDNAYALSHPFECGVSAGCEDNNYALTHPLECSANPCSDNVYALTHPECSCTDNVYALIHPLECAAKCEETFLDSYRCAPNGYDRQRERQKSDCSKEWVTLDTCTYGCQQVWAVSSLPVICAEPQAPCEPSVSCASLGCGNYDSCGSFCGSCPPPAVVDNAPTAAINVPASAAPSSQLSILVSGNDDHDVSQLQLYDANNNLLETFDCTGIQTSCSKTFTRTAPSAFSTSYTFKARSKDSAGQFSQAFVSGTGTTTAAPAVVDNPPTATINIPSSAAPGSSIGIVVSGTDDKDVAQLLLLDSSNNQLAAFDCIGIQATCSSTFTVAAPSTHSASYIFKARSRDSAGQLSVLVSGSGATTSAPPPVTVVTQLIQQPGISLRFPLQPLFMRSVSFQDSGCVRPGESALLAVKVRNTGKSTLKGVSFTATVPELGMRARTGPHSITRADRSSKFMQLGVPADTEEGSYFLRLSVTNNRFSKVVHRAFTVGRSC